MAGAGRYAQIGRNKHGDTSHAKKSPSSNDSTAACNKTPKKDARPSASEESRVAAASNYTRRQPRHGHRRLTTLAGMSNVQRRTSAICGPSSGRRTRVTDMKFLALCQELSHREGKTSSCIIVLDSHFAVPSDSSMSLRPRKVSLEAAKKLVRAQVEQSLTAGMPAGGARTSYGGRKHGLQINYRGGSTFRRCSQDAAAGPAQRTPPQLRALRTTVSGIQSTPVRDVSLWLVLFGCCIGS